MSNEYNPFRVDANRTTTQGRAAKITTLPRALLFNRFATEIEIATKSVTMQH
jgi:hypothetical protein